MIRQYPGIVRPDCCLTIIGNPLLKFLATPLALYSSALVMKHFNKSRKLFQVKIITVMLKASLLLNALLCIHPLTFITEVFHLVVLLGSQYCINLVFLEGIHDVLR